MSMKMLITDAGLAEVVNAEQSGTAPVVLSHIAFGTGQYTPTADMTALKSEFKRFDSIKGGAIADNVIHISLHDNDKQAYTVYEVGVFTESGTLFAVSSQTTPIVQKAEDAEVMLVTDFVLSDVDVDSITIGDTNIILNPATTEAAGIVELATEAEAKAGTDATRAITPAAAKAARDADANIVHRSGNETIAGVKTFSNNPRIDKSAPMIGLMQAGVEKGTAPSEPVYAGIYIGDSTGYEAANRMAAISSEYSADGSIKCKLVAFKPESGAWDNSTISIVYPASGDPYATAPTPAAGDNSTKIATTAFVNTKAGNYLPLAGGTMSGSINLGYKQLQGIHSLELNPPIDTANNGGFVDFHFNRSSDDYTSRIIEDENGVLSVLAANGFKHNGKNIVRSINGREADSTGNIDVGGMHIGMVFPHPAATPPTGAYLLNGQTITNCRELYPDFWEWVNNSGVRSIGNNTFEAEVAEYGICNGFVLWEQSGSVRLPLWNGYQTPLGDSVPVVGNGMTLGLTDGVYNTGLYDSDSGNAVQNVNTVYGQPYGTKGANNVSASGALGVTTDPTKSGVVADTSNYKQDGFYWCIQVYNAATELSEQVSAQLASQIQAKAQTDLANVASVASSFKEQSVGWGMPDYSAGIEISVTTTEQSFTCPKDGFISFNAGGFNGTYGYLKVNDETIINQTSTGSGHSVSVNAFIFVGASSICKFKTGYSGVNFGNKFVFYPLKGVN